MISFLEQKAIANLFSFGRSRKAQLFHGASQSKLKKAIPAELYKTLKNLESGNQTNISKIAKQAATTIKKIVK
jgi:hypothetical protein